MSLTSPLPSARMSRSRRLSILYVDDEAPCLDIFRQMFAGDYDVRTALTVREARSALASAAFDIVFSDYRMPEINGSTFLQEVAVAHPDSYRVMLTGTLGVGHMIGELSGGIINLFMKKPWSEIDVLKAVELAEAARGLAVPPARARECGGPLESSERS